MPACIKPENGRIEMVDLPVPKPEAGQMAVKLTLTTVRGTDVHFLDKCEKGGVLKIAVTP